MVILGHLVRFNICKGVLNSAKYFKDKSVTEEHPLILSL